MQSEHLIANQVKVKDPTELIFWAMGGSLAVMLMCLAVYIIFCIGFAIHTSIKYDVPPCLKSSQCSFREEK